MNRSRLSGAMLALALPLALVVGPTAVPASAATTHIVTSHDQWGDVRNHGGKRLTLLEKRSIDIGQVSVDRVDRKARVTIRLRNVIRTPKFDQMFFVTLTERKDAPGGQWQTLAGFTTKGRYSYSSYAAVDGSGYDDCGLDVTVRPVRDEVVATIPWFCAAEGPVKVSVTSVTGLFRSDAQPSSSSDRHTISGRHTILPN